MEADVFKGIQQLQLPSKGRRDGSRERSYDRVVSLANPWGATMRLPISLGTILLCVSNICLGQTVEPTTVVRAQTLIDGASAQARHNQDILIRGNRIIEVSPTGAHPVPNGAQLIDLGNATVLTGLIDTHTHLFLQGEVPAAGGYDV